MAPKQSKMAGSDASSSSSTRTPLNADELNDEAIAKALAELEALSLEETSTAEGYLKDKRDELDNKLKETKKHLAMVREKKAELEKPMKEQMQKERQKMNAKKHKDTEKEKRESQITVWFIYGGHRFSLQMAHDTTTGEVRRMINNHLGMVKGKKYHMWFDGADIYISEGGKLGLKHLHKIVVPDGGLITLTDWEADDDDEKDEKDKKGSSVEFIALGTSSKPSDAKSSENTKEDEQMEDVEVVEDVEEKPSSNESGESDESGESKK